MIAGSVPCPMLCCDSPSCRRFAFVVSVACSIFESVQAVVNVSCRLGISRSCISDCSLWISSCARHICLYASLRSIVWTCSISCTVAPFALPQGATGDAVTCDVDVIESNVVAFIAAAAAAAANCLRRNRRHTFRWPLTFPSPLLLGFHARNWHVSLQYQAD